MRTLGIIIFLFIALVKTISAQSELVIKALKQKFPSAVNINWVKDYDYYKTSYNWKANFNLNDKKASAVFTQDGHWLQSQMEITIEEIGIEEVRSAIKKDYPGCEIISVIIHNSLFIGTWYYIKAKCENKESESSYDSNGWPFPPKM